jgi:hypothetical protein
MRGLWLAEDYKIGCPRRVDHELDTKLIGHGMVPPFMRNRGLLCPFIEKFLDGGRFCLCGFTLFLPDLIDLGRKFSEGGEGLGRVSRVKAGPHGFTQLYQR